MNLLATCWLWPLKALQVGSTLELVRCRPTVIANTTEPNKASGSTANFTVRSVCCTAASPKFLRFVIFQTVQLAISRFLMGWMDAELEWKDRQLRSNGGSGLDKATHLTVFNACQSVVGLPSMIIFGMLVAKMGHRIAPFIATNLL